MAGKLPWFPFFGRDFMLDPFVRALPDDVRMYYTELLIVQANEGALHDDSEWLRCQVIRPPSPRKWKQAWRLLAPAFEPAGDGLLVNRRMMEAQDAVRAPKATATRTENADSPSKEALKKRRQREAKRGTVPAASRDMSPDCPPGVPAMSPPCPQGVPGRMGDPHAPVAESESETESDAEQEKTPPAGAGAGAEVRARPEQTRSAQIAAVVRYLHPDEGGRRIVYRADRAGSYADPPHDLLREIAKTAIDIAPDLAPELRSDMNAIALRCVEAYDAIRAAQAPQHQGIYGWNLAAWIRQRDAISRIVTGHAPSPPQWKPGQSPPGRKPRGPGVAPVADWSDVNSGKTPQGLVP